MNKKKHHRKLAAGYRQISKSKGFEPKRYHRSKGWRLK